MLYYKSTMKTIYVMMGIPGGGKSTWIRNNVPCDAVICSADHFFEDKQGNYNWNPKQATIAHIVCMKKYLNALDNPAVQHIVVDNTNTTKSTMRNYVLEANKRGYPVNIVAILADPHIAASRNVHDVPAETIHAMHKELWKTIQSGFPDNWQVTRFVFENTK